MMDKLDTCMICNHEFKEDQSVVVVDDAKYRAFALGNEFEPNIDAPYRAVYCNDCWSKLVVYSWRLQREASGEDMNRIQEALEGYVQDSLFSSEFEEEVWELSRSWNRIKSFIAERKVADGR
jgi:DNA-directed RNA polymerase subunit RPC12/RpoP